jgi:hypothetical protein
MGSAGKEKVKSECRPVAGPDRGLNVTPRESGQTDRGLSLQENLQNF